MPRYDHPSYRGGHQKPSERRTAAMETINRTWPRQVVISPSYGAGLATWWDTDIAYDIVEHPTTIEAVTNGDTWEQFQQRLLDVGFDPEVVADLYGGGWAEAIVATAHGPYIIVEYDGSEAISERDSIAWRR